MRRSLAIVLALLAVVGDVAAAPGRRAAPPAAASRDGAARERSAPASRRADAGERSVGLARALHAVVVDNAAPPTGSGRHPHLLDRLRGNRRRGGAHNRLRRFLFEKVPTVARTVYDAERLTEERVIAEAGGDVFGVQVGLTVSQIDTVKPRGSGEIVHVVNLDGSANLEFVALRRELGHGQRVELQGPALNGGAGLGARLVGIGLTGDMLSGRAPKGTSYTLEAKITDRTLLRWAELFGPLALASLSRSLEGGAGDAVARVLGAAVPGVSAGLAAVSLRRAWVTLRAPAATRFDKVLAVAHAAADVVRVVDPLTGTLANAALVVVSVGVTAYQLAGLRHDALMLARAQADFDRHEGVNQPFRVPDDGGDPRTR